MVMCLVWVFLLTYLAFSLFSDNRSSLCPVGKFILCGLDEDKQANLFL